MKKVTAIVLALITVFLFALIGWFLYKNFPTTPVLIINLVLIMTGVLLGYTVYNRVYIDSITNYYDYKESHFPEPEMALIYAVADDFCNKIEYNTGSMNIVGVEEIIRDVKVTKAVYNKLLDEVDLTFSKGLNIKVKGLNTIAIGDEQFMFYGFKEMEFKSKDEKLKLIWDDSHLALEKNDIQYTVRMPDGEPTFAFDWSENID
jgi:hypothetical protein